MAAAAFKTSVFAAFGLLGCTSIAADARTFEGTRWHVSAINGHATPPSGSQFEIRFDNHRIGGRIGCNHFGGGYAVTGDVMTTNGIAMTRMACDTVGDRPGPSLMEYERHGHAVLARPMRIGWKSSRELMLSNAAGSIALELQP
jgi:heat shock protein HslJ